MPNYFRDIKIFALNLLNYLPYLLSCPTCSRALLALVPRALRPLVPYVLSCLVPYVLSCLMCPKCCRASRASCAMCCRASRVSCPTCSRALHGSRPTYIFSLRALCLTCLVPNVLSCFACLTCCCTSRVLCLAYSRAAHASNSMCSCPPRPSLASGVSSRTCSYACHFCSFHALCLLYFCCVSYLNFLQSGLRLIIVIGSKDTLNINDINTLYPLRVATYVKNEFQNLQKGFKSNRRGLGYV